MWDRPELLDRVSGALIALSVLLVAYAGIVGIANAPWFPVRLVSASNALDPDGQLRHVTRDQMQAVASERLSGTIFTVDLEAARAAFAALPWVRNVEVRRTWPDRLEVAIEEQVEFANWSGGKLVNTHGELFDGARIEGLPEFSGPPGSEAEVTRRYIEVAAPLKKLGFAARQIALSPRLAWELKLDNGMLLKLGRDLTKDPITRRIERFTDAYADSAARVSGRLDVADLRYTQGFALHLPPGAAMRSASGKTPDTAGDGNHKDGNKHAPAAAKGRA
jgi:cell division protein FtsQ